MEVDAAWKALPAHRHGQDLAALLAIERVAIESMATPSARAGCAARLGRVLEQTSATHDAKQWVCLMLRAVGTASEVPILARELSSPDPQVADAARQAIEAIGGDASLVALRSFLRAAQSPTGQKRPGPLRAGIINALGARRDAEAVPLVVALADDTDPQVAEAALRALGHIADMRSVAWLRARAERVGVPMPPLLGESLVRAAEAEALAGNRDAARAIYELLARPGQPVGVRQAGLVGQLNQLEASSVQHARMLLAWLHDADLQRRAIAAGSLASLDDASLVGLLETLAAYDPAIRQSILAIAARRVPDAAMPVLLRVARDDVPAVRVTAIECLGQTGAAESIPVLLDAMADKDAMPRGGDLSRAAHDSLLQLPKSLVGPALVAALDTRPELRLPIIMLLGDVGDRAAIEPLATIAAVDDPAPWQPALDTLRRLAQPNATDVGRLVDLFLEVRGDARKEAVARVIVGVAQQSVPTQNASVTQPVNESAAIVIAALEKRGVPAVDSLPLVGRLGGTTALAKIETGLQSVDAQVRDAAIRGLSHWPTAEVADRLLSIAKESLAAVERQSLGRKALRAYVRVLTLKSERPAAQTLAMLEQAMDLAADGPAEDRGYILERTAAAVRSMDAVEWIASYLDEPSLAQAACRALVELAHHRSLRQPNKDRFDTILNRVAMTTTDPAIADRARRYALGL